MEITETIDLEQFTRDGKVPPHGKHYKVKVGETIVIFEKQVVTGREILEGAGYKHPECYWLYQKLKGCDFEKIDPDEKLDLANGGVEHFAVKPTEVFHYFVDGEPETTDQKQMTPNQILGDAGLNPVKDYYLVRVNADGSQDSFKNSPEKPIKMVCPSVKFVSAFRGETPVS
jgi:hypothetical protein